MSATDERLRLGRLENSGPMGVGTVLGVSRSLNMTVATLTKVTDKSSFPYLPYHVLWGVGELYKTLFQPE